jgi:hypothetical protein
MNFSNVRPGAPCIHNLDLKFEGCRLHFVSLPRGRSGKNGMETIFAGGKGQLLDQRISPSWESYPAGSHSEKHAWLIMRRRARSGKSGIALLFRQRTPASLVDDSGARIG